MLAVLFWTVKFPKLRVPLWHKSILCSLPSPRREGKQCQHEVMLIALPWSLNSSTNSSTKCQANLLVCKQAKTSELWQFSQPVIMHLWLNTSPPMVSSKELNMNMRKSQNPAANLGDSERVEEHAELFHKKQATNQTTNTTGDAGNLNKKRLPLL